MIVADTSAWVQFLRRPDSPEGREMRSLIRQGQVALTGVVVAEVIQGARDEGHREELMDLLSALPFLQASYATWARAGLLSFRLRQAGQRLPLTDVAVAAVALEHDCPIFTLDDHFQRVPGLRLHEVEAK